MRVFFSRVLKRASNSYSNSFIHSKSLERRQLQSGYIHIRPCSRKIRSSKIWTHGLKKCYFFPKKKGLLKDSRVKKDDFWGGEISKLSLTAASCFIIIFFQTAVACSSLLGGHSRAKSHLSLERFPKTAFSIPIFLKVYISSHVSLNIRSNN